MNLLHYYLTLNYIYFRKFLLLFGSILFCFILRRPTALDLRIADV